MATPYFQITTRPPKDGDPKDTDYLLLVSRRLPDDEANFDRLQMWVSRDTHVPVKIISTDKSKNVTTVLFKNIQPNTKLGPEVFLIPRPAGWELVIKTLEDRRPAR